MVIILNKYKKILDNFINNSDSEFPDWLELINKRLSNILKFENYLIDFFRKKLF